MNNKSWKKFYRFLNSITKFQIAFLLILTISVNILLTVYIAFMKNNKSNYKIINNHVEKNRTILRNKKGDIVKYSDLLDCNHNYDKFLLNEKFRNNYSIEADKSLQRKNFVRGVLVYYPADQHEYFEQEFRWFYRSWIEMLKNEPSEWRTDLIVFINMKVYKSTNMKFFEQLNCFETNMRFTKDEFPMCTLLNYVELRNRQIPLYDSTYFFNTSAEELYNYFYKKVNVFDNSAENLWRFYGKLKELKKYQEEYSIKLPKQNNDDNGKEMLGLIVIKKTAKTKAFQKNNAIKNWKVCEH